MLLMGMAYNLWSVHLYTRDYIDRRVGGRGTVLEVMFVLF